jgi:serine/threonine protein kinase
VFVRNRRRRFRRGFFLKGSVKILDFGIARLARDEQSGSSETMELTSESTPGAVLGTVGYMSPEQVKGLPVDYRSDLFSFGAILCEMLSGKPPLESAFSTMR